MQAKAVRFILPLILYHIYFFDPVVLGAAKSGYKNQGGVALQKQTSRAQSFQEAFQAVKNLTRGDSLKNIANSCKNGLDGSLKTAAKVSNGIKGSWKLLQGAGSKTLKFLATGVGCPNGRQGSNLPAGDKDVILASGSDTELPVYSPIDIHLPASTCNAIVLPKFSPPRHEKVGLPKCKCTATPKSSPNASPSRLPDTRNRSSLKSPKSPTDLSPGRSSGQSPPKSRSPRDPPPRGRSSKDLSPKDRSPTDRSPKDRLPTDRSPKDLLLKDYSPNERSSRDRSPRHSPIDRSPKNYSPNERSFRDRSSSHSPLQTSAPSPPAVSGGGSPRASGGISPKVPRGGPPKVSSGGRPKVSGRGSPKPYPEGSRDALTLQAATQLLAGVASSRRPKAPFNDVSTAPPRSPAYSSPKVEPQTEPKAPPKIRSKSPPRRPLTLPPNDLPSLRGPHGYKRPGMQRIFRQISMGRFPSQCENPRDHAPQFDPPLVPAAAQQPHDPVRRQSRTRITPMPGPEPPVHIEDPRQFFLRMSRKLMSYFMLESPKLKQRCMEDCNAAYGYLLIPPDGFVSDDLAELFTCGSLVPITDGMGDPNFYAYIDQDGGAHYRCWCPTHVDMCVTLDMYEVDPDGWNEARTQGGGRARRFLRKVFRGTGVQVLTYQRVMEMTDRFYRGWWETFRETERDIYKKHELIPANDEYWKNEAEFWREPNREEPNGEEPE